MAKCGKLTKLKSTVMKKWTSFSRTSNNNNNNNNKIGTIDDHKDYLPVYVGKSLRRYLVDSETMANPVFRGLVERSSSSSSSSSALCEESSFVVIGCEVVLFEHLLWMLNNCNDNELKDGVGYDDDDNWNANELVEFYAC